MATRTCRVGVHGRNHEEWHDLDFEVLREANLEVVKMMSQTRPHHFERIKRENPDIEIITRLHGGGFGTGGHPSPEDFANEIIPIMGNLRPYCTKFQVHNEPNHFQRYEGWGPEDADARDFNDWFLQVYRILKDAHSWASIGFPGLALAPAHRYREWAEICRPAIKRSDWLGVHSYWQTPTNTMMSEDGGLSFKFFHSLYPNKAIELLECGNSDKDNNFPITEEEIAGQYVQWLQEVFKYDYVNSASFFILSSQDAKNWEFFSWRTENNFKKNVVQRMGSMVRPALRQVFSPKPKPQPKPKPEQPITMPLGLTNGMVINAFNKASLDLGMKNWGLMTRAGLSLNKLASRRREDYVGPGLDDMPKLTDEQRQQVRLYIPDDISFDLEVRTAYFTQSKDLSTFSLDLPRSLRIKISTAKNAIERRVARTWNRYGNLLTEISDLLGIDLDAAVAIVSLDSDQRSFGADGRLAIRFEVAVFHGRWGLEHEELFQRHFRFDHVRPWQKHQYRLSEQDAWQDVHASHMSEWAAFKLARDLAWDAAYESTEMGFPRMMGFNYRHVGYESAGQMFDAFASSDRYQLLAIFDFIAGEHGDTRRLSALLEEDLDAFAALHWGPEMAARQAYLLKSAVSAFARLNPLVDEDDAGEIE